MADIMLAEFEGRVWLVGGEAHLDDLLANTLSPDLASNWCRAKVSADVHDLWAQHGGDPRPACRG